ncbi:MAG: hypothetical protein ACK56I_15800, partial [bacterium]
ARLASIREQQASLAAQPLVRWLPTEARLAVTESLAPAEMTKQPQECGQRTPQPQQLRDQPKGHSVRQQQELYEPSPSNMDWPRSQGEEDAMHNSRRTEVAEALIPSPTKKDPPTARNGRPTASGMSAGVTAATADEDGSAAPLSGETAPMKAEAQAPHPAE